MDRQVETQDKAKDKNMKIRIRKLQDLGAETENLSMHCADFWSSNIFLYFFYKLLSFKKKIF